MEDSKHCSINNVYCFRSDIIIKNQKRAPNYSEALDYFEAIAMYTDELRKLQRSLRMTIR